MIFWILSLLAIDGSLTTVRQFEAVPPSSGTFMVTPISMSVAEDKVFVADVNGPAVFMWDKETGRFLGSFGKQGNGPGEMENPYLIAANKDHLAVYDVGLQRTLIFDQEGKFIRQPQILLPARPVYMYLPGESTILMSCQYYGVPKVKLHKYNFKGKPIGQMKPLKDESYRLITKQKTMLIGYSGKPVLAQMDSQHFIYGLSGQPKFEVIDLEGNTVREVSFRLPRREVTEEDEEEFKEQVWIGFARKYMDIDFEFHDYHPFYTSIFPYGSDGYVLIDATPVSRFIRGYVLDSQGQILKRFQHNGGFNSLFHIADKKIYSIQETGSGFVFLEKEIPK